LQRHRADVVFPLRPRALFDQLPGALALDPGERDLALAPDDARVDDRHLFPRGGDARAGLGQLRVDRDGVQPRQHLAGLDEIALTGSPGPQRLPAETSTSFASTRPLRANPRLPSAHGVVAKNAAAATATSARIRSCASWLLALARLWVWRQPG
jgi:hypothetical protein